MNREYENALQACLEMLQDANETIESIVARYPMYADELRPELETVQWLRVRRNALAPSPEFLATSRQRVLNRIRFESSRERERQPARRPWLETLNEFIQQNLQSKTTVPFAFVLVLLIMLFTGGRVLIPVANESLPGDQLYAAKLALEQAELAVSMDNSDAAQINVTLTERRFKEILQMIAFGRFENLDDSVNNFEDQVNQAVDSVNAMASENIFEAAILAASLEDILAEQNRTLTILDRSVPSEVRAAIGKAIRASRTGVNAVQQIRLTLPPVVVVVASPTQEPTDTPQVIIRFTPTSAPTIPATSTPSPRPLPTEPPEPTATATRIPTATPTPLPPTPTNTPNPTDTPVPPTDTPVPPTFTPEPPMDTPTPVPPTDTPTPLPPTDTPVLPTLPPTTPPPTNPPPTSPPPTPTGGSLPSNTPTSAPLTTATATSVPVLNPTEPPPSQVPTVPSFTPTPSLPPP